MIKRSGELSALAISAFVWMAISTRPVKADTPPGKGETAARELRRLEAELNVALSGSEVDRLTHLWADDFVSTMADGHVVTREKRLASLRATRPDAAVKLSSNIDQLDVHTYGNWALVLVTSSWRIDGKQVGDPYQATHVWAKRRGQWRLVAAHISTVKL